MSGSRLTIISIIIVILTSIIGVLLNIIEPPTAIRPYVWFLIPILGMVIMLLMVLNEQWKLARHKNSPSNRRGFLHSSAPTIGAVVTTIVLGSTIWYGNYRSDRDLDLLAKERELLEKAQKSTLKRLNIGFLPPGDRAGEKSDTRLLEKYLQEELNVPVTSIYPGTTYADTVDALANKSVEMAWLGPLSYLHAFEKHKVQAILSDLNTGGRKEYQSYIITRKDSGLKSLQDLQDKAFAFVDPISTSGGLIPKYILKKAGVKIDKNKEEYLGSHTDVLDYVLENIYPAGAVSSILYYEKLGKGEFKEDDIHIIARSDPFPTGPIVLRADISQFDVLNIQNELLSIEEVDKAILNTVGFAGFAKVIDKSYDGIREIARELNVDTSNRIEEK